MKTKKNVLIITDDSAEIVKMAAGLAAALKGSKVTVKSASGFRGNDLLPAEVLFLGCEKPNPESFAYLSDVLKHVNLAGRPCGVFSSGSEKAVKYLAGLAKDCEAALNPEFLLSGSGKNISGWAKKVVQGAF